MERENTAESADFASAMENKDTEMEDVAGEGEEHMEDGEHAEHEMEGEEGEHAEGEEHHDEQEEGEHHEGEEHHEEEGEHHEGEEQHEGEGDEEHAADEHMEEEGGEHAKEEEKQEKEEDEEKVKEEGDVKEEGHEAAAAPSKELKPQKTETEQDAGEDLRERLPTDKIDLNGPESSLNVMLSAENRIMMMISEGGFQYLLGGVRSTVGLKSGRYAFEITVLETLSGKPEQGHGGVRPPYPRSLIRLGLSTAGSSLLMGDGTSDHIAFDSEGVFVSGKARTKLSQSARFHHGCSMTLLVNLDPASPNHNTVSLFKNGLRVSEPQKIPERLQGKALFPTITAKNVSLQINLGPTLEKPLSFKCRTLLDVAAADVDVVEVAKKEAGGKCEVIFPVGLPEKGFFDWVDHFLAKNPTYTELSDRKIIEWASASGLAKPKGFGCNDRPDMKFGLPSMDDGSISRLLSRLAAAKSDRNIIVPTLLDNLLSARRVQALARFPASVYSRNATVLIGNPSTGYLEHIQSILLGEKRQKAEMAQKKKSLEERRLKMIEIKKKKALIAKQKKEGTAVDEEPEEMDTEVTPEEVLVELTDEEKALLVRKTSQVDLPEVLVSNSFGKFTLPTLEEGFTNIKYEWSGEEEAQKILKDWIFAKKMTQRVTDINVGDRFKELSTNWNKSMTQWKHLQMQWKDPAKRKVMIKKKEDKLKKEAEEKSKEEGKEEAVEPEKVEEVDFDAIDIEGVEDISDLGDCRPLFSDFGSEDWILLSTRFEIHLLIHCFKQDVNDPDRPGFSENDLEYYFRRYFKKPFSLKNYNLEKASDLQNLIKDSFKISEKTGFLEAVMDVDTPIEQFVKLTEEHRRERQRRLDAGDESAELKFPKTALGGGGGKTLTPGQGHKRSHHKQFRGVRPHIARPMRPALGASTHSSNNRSNNNTNSSGGNRVAPRPRSVPQRPQSVPPRAPSGPAMVPRQRPHPPASVPSNWQPRPAAPRPPAGFRPRAPSALRPNQPANVAVKRPWSAPAPVPPQKRPRVVSASAAKGAGKGKGGGGGGGKGYFQQRY